MKVPIQWWSVIAGAFLVAQTLVASQGPGVHRNMRMYNPSTETTINGTVEDVTNPSRGPMMGTHLSVKTAEVLVAVALGPAKFISSQGLSFARGDAVGIVGSKVTMAGQDWIIAREVVKDGKTLTLRDRDGNPKWAHGMMGRGTSAQQ